MPQLLKHYMINRDNGQYIIDEPHGYVYPQIPELQIVYILSKDNGVLYCLSTCSEDYVVPETDGEGLQVITQQEWDDIITEFDNRQQEKRYNILRDIRDEILKITDWMIIRDLEQQEVISTEFKTWRQALRDLPNSVEFPSSFPTLPTELEAHTEIQQLYSRFDEVRQISMVNDNLPSLQNPSLDNRVLEV